MELVRALSLVAAFAALCLTGCGGSPNEPARDVAGPPGVVSPHFVEDPDADDDLPPAPRPGGARRK